MPGWAPEGLRAAIAARGATVDRAWEEHPRAYLYASSATGPLFARASADPGDAAVLAHEASVRRLLGVEGPLRAPRVLAAGAQWMLEAAVIAQPLAGEAAIDAAVAAAAELAGRTDLPRLEAGRREGRLRMLRRRGRAVRGGVPIRDVVAARRARKASGSPAVVSHGDFHAGNLLWDGAALWVVDWELLGRRAAGWDLMSLWPTLTHPADRERLFDAAAAALGPRGRHALAPLRHAAVVAVAMGKLAPDRAYNADPAGARALLRLLPALRATRRGANPG